MTYLGGFVPFLEPIPFTHSGAEGGVWRAELRDLNVGSNGYADYYSIENGVCTFSNQSLGATKWAFPTTEYTSADCGTNLNQYACAGRGNIWYEDNSTCNINNRPCAGGYVTYDISSPGQVDQYGRMGWKYPYTFSCR